MRRVVLLMFVVLITGAASAVSGRTVAEDVSERATAPVAVQGVSLPSAGIRDEAAMILVGTALIGLAAAVRRAA